MPSSSAQLDTISFGPDFAEHFLKVYSEGRSSCTGPRMHNIMLVLPYIIRDIAGPEIALINAAINNAVSGDPLYGMVHVEGPCVTIIRF